MALTKKFSLSAIVVALSMILGLSYTAYANPSFFTRTNNGNCGVVSATTSVTYMTAGTATTTIPFDTSCAGAGSQDSATLLLQFIASSTSSTLNVTYEYAQETTNSCITFPTSCDWYQDNTYATSTNTYSVSANSPLSYNWNFASSSQGGAPVASTSQRVLKAFTAKTPTRYVRAIISMPVGSTAGAVWGEFVGKRQAN